ncbi:MAG TPA: aldo/keto reductase [Candidatus Binataceae bacterium]|jgi:aryl-alcohol dehydrogenase (NADP+)|nr:aldo/keto reductase [Candidatus Binataceae bacterium]
MEYVKLGKTGLSVSRICLGCMSYGDKRWREWVITGDEAREHFAAALEAGVNFFDTADVYSGGVSEEITGRWLGEMAARDDVVIATKVHGPMGPGPNRRGLSRKHILEACDASLRRLRTDFIDLYQIHRWDWRTPIEETLEALDSLVRAGKVRYLGASSMAAWQFSKALYTAREHGWHRFVAMQNHYNLVYREEEREMIPLCIDQGVGVIPWSPLARGFLAGNRKPGGTGDTVRAQSDPMARSMYFRDSDFAVADAAVRIARERGVTPAQVACAWILRAPGVTAPIVGATKLNHVKELIAAVDIKLTKEETAALEAPYQPHPVLGFEPPTPERMTH